MLKVGYIQLDRHILKLEILQFHPMVVFVVGLRFYKQNLHWQDLRSFLSYSS
jgi:hypothetical protein